MGVVLGMRLRTVGTMVVVMMMVMVIIVGGGMRVVRSICTMRDARGRGEKEVVVGNTSRWRSLTAGWRRD